MIGLKSGINSLPYELGCIYFDFVKFWQDVIHLEGTIKIKIN